MADSLDNFFKKAGGKLSFGNKFKRSKPPKGSTIYSGLYYGPGDAEGITRTQGPLYLENPNPSPGQSFGGVPLTDSNHKFGLNRTYPSGFTPVSYYRISPESEVIIPDPNDPSVKRQLNTKDRFDINTSSLNAGVGISGAIVDLEGYEGVGGFDDKSSFDFKYNLNNQENWPGGSSPMMPSGKNDIESFDGSFGSKSWDNMDSQEFNKQAVAWSNGTPHENEDPVIFGFEIIIDSIRSPLLNGELDYFLETIGVSNDELTSRKEISSSFKNEMSKFFKFNLETPSEDIFGMTTRKRHYIKSIDGLENLIESNSSSKLKSFVDYKQDVLKIQFYEDINLSTGSLSALYKLLYWSKIRGKGVVPENLLRFDCEIIVSELRNISRVRKAANSGVGSQYAMEVLKENLSRYVYSVYECQLFFSKMSHSGDITLESLSTQPNVQIEMNYKFSNMRFERFNLNDSVYRSINDRRVDPSNIDPTDENSNIENTEGSIQISKTAKTPIRIRPIVDGLAAFSEGELGTDDNEFISTITFARKNFKRRALDKIKDALINSSKNLANSLKKAALTEAQRQLNSQFRLLNNAIDQVRNAYGIGRMSEPTNVYSRPANGSSIFFDVRNSLRGFGGDLLGGLL